MRRLVLLFVLLTACVRNDRARTILASPTGRFPLTWQELDENPKLVIWRDFPTADAEDKARIAGNNAIDVTSEVERSYIWGAKKFDADAVRVELQAADIRDTSTGETACPGIHPEIVSAPAVGAAVDTSMRQLGLKMGGQNTKGKRIIAVTPVADVRTCHEDRVAWQLMLEVRSDGRLLTTAYAGPASSLRGNLAQAAYAAVLAMHTDRQLIAFAKGEDVATLYAEDGGLFGKRRPQPPATAPPEQTHQLTAPLSLLLLPLKPLGSVAPETCELLTSYMLSSLDQVKQLRSVGKDDIESTLSADKERQALGCDALACMVEIGGALGVDVVAYGQVGMIGTKYNINVSVVRSSDSRVVARSSIIVDTPDGLTASMPILVNQVVDRLNER